MSGRRRWLWGAVAAVAVAFVALLTWWATTDTRSGSSSDCAVVEDVARQWNDNSAAVRNTLLNGGGRPEDYRTVADRQQQMADTLRAAVDSVEAVAIKDELDRWADGAEKFAALQRSAAEAQGAQARPSDADFETVARLMNEAAVALSEQCPAMPSAE
ncbi:hypothetical protein [Mycolicibacterium austroafricanum]|uniref:hypothetical protein n=1 Tax=Mycolicibacterium austroafricanum TaxID=39687 RepID=UPI001CA32088|nr:hypothetical protein [Mycolicibacterium austroafricanum]QZT61178.1 hypothetical protein JN085_19585 [Mycolicibacterium austroafricanum]